MQQLKDCGVSQVVGDLRVTVGDKDGGPPSSHTPSPKNRPLIRGQKSHSLLMQFTNLAFEVNQMVAQSYGVQQIAKEPIGATLRLICTPTRVILCDSAQPVVYINDPSTGRRSSTVP